ncbi:MAG TPA: CHAP domain-containing protein [Terrimicrobiaceae bacterium]
MPHLFKLPNDAGGFDRTRNLFVMPQNSVSTFYLIAGQDLTVDSSDKSTFTVNGQSGDDTGAHKMAGLSDWEKAQHIRKLVLKSGSKTGDAKLLARDSGNNDQILPLDVFVVADSNARRVTDSVGIEPTLKMKLEELSLRQAVLRIAEDQLYSNVKTNQQGCTLYHLDSRSGTLWCGAFAYWCWQQAALVKKVANPFDKQDHLLSPQKAINWGMRDDSPGQLLQYKGPNPMTMKGASQELREIGYNGYSVEPGDIACWRQGHSMGFKHVSLVEKVNGKTFVDLNGNAYDAGSGSALARISHDDMGRKLPDGSYKCFFLHVLI